MLGWFKWAGRWRRQLDALVQHAGSRATSEAQMALDLGKLNDQMKRVTTVMGALVDVITTQNATINRLNDKISQLSTPTVDPADQTAVDVRRRGARRHRRRR
jgi:hypothetical protein